MVVPGRPVRVAVLLLVCRRAPHVERPHVHTW